MRLAPVLLVAALCAAPALAQTTFTVTTAADAGAGSLRQAILDANANPGADAVHFAIAGGGPHTIQVQTALPSVTGPVTIDGLTQPGADCSSWPATLLIVLDGSQAPDDTDGLTLAAEAVTLRGLVIGGFQAASPTAPVGGNGVVITGDAAVLACNFIGSASTGIGYNRNEGAGILIVGADGATVGGASGSARNLITGNRPGIRLQGATGARIEGNYIGPWAPGTFGGNFGDGVLLEGGSSNNTVGGGAQGAGNLISANLGRGVRIAGGTTTGNTVAGNLIGLSPDGSLLVPNSAHGVEIDGAPGNTIGGTDPGRRNVIAGNDGSGVFITGATGTVVRGNHIGTDPAGLVARPNLGDGVFILRASGTVVGGTEPGARNVISGNETIGVEIDGTSGTATGNVVAGNYIGTDATGNAALPNLDDGVLIENAAGNTIGGDVAARNVISANGDDGVDVFGAATQANVVRNNHIGTNAAGTALLGNAEDGIDINGGATGTEASDNVIAGNAEVGVYVQDAGTQRNAVRRNRIYGNGGLGIDLGSAGPTPNDPGDEDEGPNRLQNVPEVASATGDDASTLTILYTVPTATASATYPLRVEFFLADADDQEGRTFIGSDTYEAAEAGQPASAVFAPASPVLDADRVVATATDADGNTSEFGAAVTVVGGTVANESGAEAPAGFALSAAYPNPFTLSTVLLLDVPEAGAVTATVYDALGRRVAVLHDGPLAAGPHALRFDAAGLPSGAYLVRAASAADAVTRRITLLR